MDHFKQYMKSTGMDVQMEYLGDQQLLALQVCVLSTALCQCNPSAIFIILYMGFDFVLTKRLIPCDNKILNFPIV